MQEAPAQQSQSAPVPRHSQKPIGLRVKALEATLCGSECGANDGILPRIKALEMLYYGAIQNRGGSLNDRLQALEAELC